MLVDPDESKICRVKPISVTESATYVVDVRNLQNTEDIKKDEFGIWNTLGHIRRCLRFTLKKMAAKVLKSVAKVHQGAT